MARRSFELREAKFRGRRRARALCARCVRRAASASTADMEIRFFLRALFHNRNARHMNHRQHRYTDFARPFRCNNSPCFIPLSVEADRNDVVRVPITQDFDYSYAVHAAADLGLFHKRTCLLKFCLWFGTSVPRVWLLPIITAYVFFFFSYII